MGETIMSYAFTCGRSLDSEVRRIAERQLTLAIEEMQPDRERRGDETIHEARRRVKKVRALLRLVRPAFAVKSGPINKQLRNVSRLLAPISDSEARAATLGRLGTRYPQQLPAHGVTTLQRTLGRRTARIVHAADVDRVFERASAILRRQQRHVREWRLRKRGFRAVGPGLAIGLRRMRRAMAEATAHPSGRSYHVWRERVKDHWFHVRLLELRCGGWLADYEKTLEQLDGVLGEYHNCILLQNTIIVEAHLRRDDAARILRVLRRYKGELRREALRLADDLGPQSVSEFVEQVQRHWRTTGDGAREQPPTENARASWGRVA
jgi:hypothetical protein